MSVLTMCYAVEEVLILQRSESEWETPQGLEIMLGLGRCSAEHLRITTENSHRGQRMSP
jgi:hypothetical protein